MSNVIMTRISRPTLVFGFLLVLVCFSQLQNQSQLDSVRPFFAGLSSGNKDLSVPAASSSHPHYYTCPFRNHSRFYGLTSDNYPPAFLRSAFYIHGKPPILLPISSTATTSTSTTTKICFQPSPSHLQLEIQNLTTGQSDLLPLKQPLMDGTNPTVVSLYRLRTELLPSLSLEAFQYLRQAFPTATYLVSNTFKSANQCEYDLAQKKKDKHKSLKEKEYVVADKNRPPGRQYRNEVDLMLVDAQFRTLWQTTILSSTITKKNHTTSLSADDARLLVHNGELFLTFKRYGDQGGNGAVLYLAQLQGILRDAAAKTNNMEGVRTKVVQVVAVQEWAMCCGRNYMALSTIPAASDDSEKAKPAQSTTPMSFLTWPDPIWVQSFDITGTPPKDDGAPIAVKFQNPPIASAQNAMGKTSKFHGTSGFLLYLAETREYLGVGHLHRERKWAKDFRVDAKFGHHYTHAFFTMTSAPPYQLTRVSPEFLFPSTADPKDADIIQFASGLEWAHPGQDNGGGDDGKGGRQQIVITYGINDCEGAVVHVDWETVEGLLRPVPKGSQVVHTIGNMTREDFLQAIQEQT